MPSGPWRLAQGPYPCFLISSPLLSFLMSSWRTLFLVPRNSCCRRRGASFCALCVLSRALLWLVGTLARPLVAASWCSWLAVAVAVALSIRSSSERAAGDQTATHSHSPIAAHPHQCIPVQSSLSLFFPFLSRPRCAVAVLWCDATLRCCSLATALRC